MANNVSIENRNGTLIISIGPAGSVPQGGSADHPSTVRNREEEGGAAGDPSTSGSGGPGGNCCNGLTVIGPIVIPCGALDGGHGKSGGSAGDPSTSGSQHVTGGAAGDPSTSGSGGISMCGGPTVIGPIVLGGCTCGAVDSRGHSSGSSAVSVNPPGATPGEGKRPLTEAGARTAFVMQQQKLANWCWDAVAVSVRDFLNPGAAPSLTQEDLATRVLSADGKIAASVDCSATPELCNLPAALDDALRQTGNLYEALLDKHLVCDPIVAWVEAGMPIGASITWFSGGAHFVAVDGYRDFGDSGQQVHIQDPLHGPGLQDYNVFVSNYPPGGSWNDTYLMKIAE